MRRKNIYRWLVVLALLLTLGLFLRGAYQVPVLMYHSIDYNAKQSRLSVTPESFEKQMQFLRRNGYTILSLEGYVNLLNYGKKPRTRSVVITFDDGFANNYTAAYPILKKYKIPATIFVVVNWIDTENMLTWQQLDELSRSNLVEIGSHSLSHPDLRKLEGEEVIQELEQSKQILEMKLRKRINFFCYPCGYFNSLVKNNVKVSGYTAACATKVGKETPLDDIYALRRIRISDSADNLIIFWAQISGYYTFFKDRRIKKNDKDSGY